jgi:DNA-binding transcriptional ArsR family regulator
MAEAKKHTDFDRHSIELANMAKALAHPARITILKTLARYDSCFCGKIVDVIPLAQSTVSQHLKALKEAGMINGEVTGTQSCYCINREQIRQLLNLVKILENSIAQPAEATEQ